MRPGDKTRAPLRTGELDQRAKPLQLRLTVVFHPDCARIGASLILGALDASGLLHLDATMLGRNAPLFGDGLGLDEPHISRRALTLRHHARGLQLLNASDNSYTQLGPEKASSMSLSFKELEYGVAIRFGHAVVCWLRLVPELATYIAPENVKSVDNLVTSFTGVSPQASNVRRLISIAASSDLPVLLRGESGVGKEVAAMAIHAASTRSNKPLIVLNMAALPETLAEAELFGSARGAFTGAEKRSGYFTQANDGTLFLDEIGDLPMSVQPKLLRALQTGEVQVVGGRSYSVDVRIIAASDADLNDNTGFKNALLQRLAGITINLPPLRERLEDLGILLATSEHTRPLLYKSMKPRDAAAWASFVYDALYQAWPGNVREFLLSAQRFALSLHHDTKNGLTKRHFIVHTSEDNRSNPKVLTDAEIEAIHEQSEFEIAETARRLGLSRGALYRRVETIPGVRLSADYSDAEIEDALGRVGPNLSALSRALRLSKASIASRLRLMGVR
jgi:transcriptional regulator with GAF, ATPase, and Fis domain